MLSNTGRIGMNSKVMVGSLIASFVASSTYALYLIYTLSHNISYVNVGQ